MAEILSYRTVSIYVRSDTRQRCHWLAGSEHGMGMTADEVADNILNEWIEKNYPAVIKLEKEINRLKEGLRDELAKNLMKKAHDDPTLNPEAKKNEKRSDKTTDSNPHIEQ